MIPQPMTSVILMRIRNYFTCTRDWRRLPIALAVALGATGAFAQTNAAFETDCRLEAIGTGAARRVIDGRTFQLADGQHVRLAAVEVPPMPLPGESGP